MPSVQYRKVLPVCQQLQWPSACGSPEGWNVMQGSKWGGGGREIKSILMRKVLRGATLTRIGHAPGSPTLTSPTQTGRRYERPRPCSLPPTPGHRAGGSGPAPPPPPPPPGADAHHSAAARPPQRPGSRLETRGWGGEGAVGAGRARRRPRPPARPGVCPLL